MALRQERRADALAGWILFGGEVDGARYMSLDDLAELGNVTSDFVRRWGEIAEWEIRTRGGAGLKAAAT